MRIKSLNKMIIGTTLIATVGAVGGNLSQIRNQNQKEIEQIKCSLTNTNTSTKDSACYNYITILKPDYQTFEIQQAYLKKAHAENYYRDFIHDAVKNEPLIYGRLGYWQSIQEISNEIQKHIRYLDKLIITELIDRTKRLKRYQDCLTFINSRTFNDFIRKQKISQKEFLQKNPNYKLIQTTKFEIDWIQPTNIEEVKEITKIGSLPFRQRAFKIVKEHIRRDNGKGISCYDVDNFVWYDANPYKKGEVTSFISTEKAIGKKLILVCKKYVK